MDGFGFGEKEGGGLWSFGKPRIIQTTTLVLL